MLVYDTEHGPVGPVHWPFTPNDWGDVFQINAPDLSAREKVRLDRLIHRKPAVVARAFGFASEKSKKEGVVLSRVMRSCAGIIPPSLTLKHSDL